jgi:uncharacterized protein
VFPLNEDPALPVAIYKPVQTKQRISSIDVLRGFALLGILVSNIDSFAGPEVLPEVPWGRPSSIFFNSHVHLNLAILLAKWIFVEGKMRMIFSMLFGTGLVLMTERATERNTPEFADVYLRRNMWLTLFGYLHGLLVWTGDILLPYGLSALLILYPCRKLKPKALFVIGGILTLAVSSYLLPAFLGTAGDLDLGTQVSKLAGAHRSGEPLTAEELETRKRWNDLVTSHAVTTQAIDAAMAEAHLGYLKQVVKDHLPLYTSMNISFWEFLIVESAGAMFLGMALYKIGFLTSKCSYATYAYVSIAGFLLAVPAYTWGVLRSYREGFSFYVVERYLYWPYEFTRLAGTLGVLGIVMIVIKSGRLRRAQFALAAVGRTALSNYILTSLLCQFIFLWGPWKLFGRLEYHQRHLVVVGVWVINLTTSVLWLRRFEFGPLEWLWRSLTYVRLQPWSSSRRLVP